MSRNLRSEEERFQWYQEIRKLREQGLTWKDIAELVGEPTSRIQKRYSLYRQRFGDIEIPEPLERRGIFHYRQKAKKLEEQFAVYSILEQIAEKFSSDLHVDFNPTPVRTPEKQELLLLFGDWHFGEIVSDDVMRGINKYNIDIAIKGVEQVVEKVLKIAQLYEGRFDTLNIVFLGDIVSGRIHEDIRRGSIAASVQFLKAVKLIREVIKTFAERFFLRIYGVPGNHGRLDKRMSFKFIYDNLDWMVYKTVELMFEGSNTISFDFPDSFSVDFNIFKFNFVATHGANVRMHYKLPFYGLYTLWETEAAYMAQKGKFLDYLLVGHFHQPGQLPVPGSYGLQGYIVLNGALVGPNEYSFGKGLKPSPPSQSLFFVHPRYGLTERMELIREKK